jgi:predicted CoA-binding protein
MTMASPHEVFWTQSRFAFVGHSATKGFPRLSYRNAKKCGKTVFAVDPSVEQIDGDRTYPDLRSLPEPVDAIVVEVPREETVAWVRQAADAGIKNVWVHMNRDSPEATALAQEKGLNLLTGTCAVMYLSGGLSAHGIHKWINKLLGKF